MKNKFFKYAIFTALMALQLIGFSQSTEPSVDHRYSPAWWQTLISLPDDPVKTLVGKEGQLFGDFNYDGPRKFSYSVMFDSKSPSVWKNQKLGSATTPIIQTTKESDGIEITEQTFQEIPSTVKENSIVRIDSRRVKLAWSKPEIDCDEAFNDIAEGLSGSSGEGFLEFHIKVKPGSSNQIALGFCEGKWQETGQRIMRVFVEGAAEKNIDPTKDFGYRTPGIYRFDSKDVNKDGELMIAVTNFPGAKDRDVFMNGIWMFSDKSFSGDEIISGKQNKNALLYAKCVEVSMPERRYHVLVNLKNTTGQSKFFNPMIRYEGIDIPKFEKSYIQIDQYTRLSSSMKIEDAQFDSVKRYTIPLEPISLKSGEQKQLGLTLSRFYKKEESYQATVSNILKNKQISENWWSKNSPSNDAITVPDEGIQSMIQLSIRNIFQARDEWGGNKAFHVGPTYYRGLWIADGSFLLEVATMLNYTKDVRSCIDNLKKNQLKDGGFDMLPTFHKENGLVPFMIIRHAMLTQDKKWLSDNWSVIEGCINRINYLRSIAMTDSSKSFYGLLPAGNVDGGIAFGNDYSNTEWCLSGMKWAISAAKWIGKTEQAYLWQKDFDSLLSIFMTLARKDIRKDEKGNTYLPVMINNEGNYPAQKGQWAFCQSVYPGQLFDVNPELHQWAEETVDMINDHKEEGLIFDTGWMSGGLWNYFSSFISHASQWLGKTEGIPQLLYDFANHASPTMVWREEQKTQGKGNEEVGDMPHNWASAEFIRMVVHMLEIDRGNELHLFEALPKQWIKANAKTRLKEIRTPFGRINLLLEVNSKADKAMVKLLFLDNGNLPERVIIHKKYWTNSTESIAVTGKQSIEMEINIQ
jgi:hypothetical protein